MKSFFAKNSLTGITGFCFFTAMALGAFSFFAYAVLEGLASRSWPVSDGVVLSSKVHTHTSQNHSNYVPKVHYKYQVHGQWYTGDRLAFGFSNRSREETSDIVDRYTPGTAIPVHFNPNRPGESVLQPGMHTINWLGFAFGVVALGLAFLRRFNDTRVQTKKQQPPRG